MAARLDLAISLAATVGLRPDTVGKLTMRMDEGLTGLCAQQVAPVAVENGPHHPRFKFFPDAGEEPFRSFLGVPILDQGVVQGVLIVLESLDPDALAAMNQSFNTRRGGYEQALTNRRRHTLRRYATFVFGYDTDTPERFARSVEFARDNRFYIAAFNHLTPFPGTPLYSRLQAEGRLLFDRWWLDERYRYNMVPFQPKTMSPAALQRECLAARRDFYGWASIARRGFDAVNRADAFMFRNFFPINAMLRADTNQRDGYPLGDETWQQPLLTVRH